jgi:hypothetical protein
MFEALMVSLLVPEAEWAPMSWGTNHPLYVRAHIEYGLRDANLGYWGLSSAAVPSGGYGVFGVAALGARTHGDKSPPPATGVVAPYASFLALPFAPTEAVANLRALAHHFPVYGPYGFRDSVDVRSGQVSDRVLVLDQGLILASLANVIGSDPLRRGFCAGPVERTIKPLIAQERFETRIDSSWNPLRPEPRPEPSTPEPSTPERRTLSSPDRILTLSRPVIQSPCLVGCILTFAGAYAVFATRSKAGKGFRPSSAGARLH